MDYIACILHIYPDALNISCIGSTRDGIEWNDPRGIPSQAALEAAWVAVSAARESEKANLPAMQTSAANALSGLRAYRDLAAPTNAQTVAVVKLLCQVAITIIRLSLGKHEATD